MALFDVFFANGIDDMFSSGMSFRAIASRLREDHIPFSDSSLREFRDTLNGSITLNLSNFSETFDVSPDLFTTTKDLPCGEYGIRVEFNGYYQSTGEKVAGHTFERVASFTNSADFIAEVAPVIRERALGNSDIVINSMSAQEGYIGEC